MHTPTKAQMQVVIDNLKKVLPMAVLPEHLDMGESQVNTNDHQCATIHCFAGWYAIAVCDLNAPLDYEDGKNAIAEHLGFNSIDDLKVDDLKVWAAYSPFMWGNIYGNSMFYDRFAFYHPVKRLSGAKNLQHIISHLEEVRDRLPV